MKLFKFIPLLAILTILNSSAYAAQDCEEIKGNIVGKMFCKAKIHTLVYKIQGVRD